VVSVPPVVDGAAVVSAPPVVSGAAVVSAPPVDSGAAVVSLLPPSSSLSPHAAAMNKTANSTTRSRFHERVMHPSK
jgi:hypothetical protein